MQPNWYSSYTPKTAAGITAMSGGSDLLAFVKYFRGTNYYNKPFNGDYKTTITVTGAQQLAMAYSVATISALAINLI